MNIDEENRLTSVAGGGTTVTFTYDARACPERRPQVASRRGNQVRKEEGGVITHYPGRHYEAALPLQFQLRGNHHRMISIIVMLRAW